MQLVFAIELVELSLEDLIAGKVPGRAENSWNLASVFRRQLETRKRLTGANSGAVPFEQTQDAFLANCLDDDVHWPRIYACHTSGLELQRAL
jgi:hypothetical protein